MKRLRKKISRSVKDLTDDEINCWKSNDLFIRLEAGYLKSWRTMSLEGFLHEAIFRDNIAQLNMRLPPAMKAVLSKLARERTTDATTVSCICGPSVWSGN
jgi:hypothetical protein